MPSPSRPSQSRPSQNVQRPCPLDDFFAFKPQPLKPGPTATKSPSTRGPQEYDKHLIDDMILKRVVVVPQMADDFMAIAQGAVDCRRKFPRKNAVSNSFLQMDTLNEDLVDRARAINKEADIQEYYHGAVAGHCATVAATLAFESKQWDTESLVWVIKKSDYSTDQHFQFPTGFGTRAHADGFLMATGHGTQCIRQLSHISRFFDCILLYEFKNLNFGTLEFMEPILSTSSQALFGWARCELGEKCCLDPKHGATGSKMGPDAQRSQLPSVQHLKEHPNDVRPYKCQLPSHVRRPKNVGDDVADEKGVPKKAYNLLQQAWTELCDNDATYIIITAGNGELVGERDRENQTLYLSGFIDIPNTQYFKLHTGIFIAAIRDAANRAALLSSTVPQGWTRRFDILLDFTLPAGQPLTELVRQEFQRRPWLVIKADDGPGAPAGPLFQNQFYLQSEVERDAIPMPNDASFTTVTVSSSPEDRYDQRRHSRGLITFKKSILPADSESAMTVFIKTAEGESDVGNLRHEHGLYLYLQEQGVPHVPPVYGYFEYNNDSRGLFGALVLQFIGKSARKWLADPQIPRTIGVTQRDAFERALLSMLDAGFVFPDICPDNLLILGEDATRIGLAGLENVQDVRWQEVYPVGHRLQIQTEVRNLFSLGKKLAHPREHAEEERAPKRRRLLTRRDKKPVGLPRRSRSFPWLNLSSVDYVAF